MVAYLFLTLVQTFVVYAIVLIIAYVISHDQSTPEAISAFARDVYTNPTAVLVGLWVTGCMLIVVKEAAKTVSKD